MKPAPPVTRIRRLAWIKQQFGTNNQDPEHANRPHTKPRGGASGIEIQRRDRALTWKNLEKRRGEGVGGGRVEMCSPLLPLVSFCAIASEHLGRPDPNQTTRQRDHTPERETIARLQATKREEAKGARRSPSSRLGIGLGLLGSDTRGTGRFESD